MRQYYRGEKLLLTLLLVVGLPVLLGGCVGVKDRFVSSEATGRLAPLSDQINLDPPSGGNNGLLIACGLREVPPKEAGIDPEAFWRDSQIAALQDALEARRLKLTFGAMRVFSSESVRLGFVPFRAEDGMVRAGIAFEGRSGQLSAVALVQQAEGTLNIHPNGREELWALVGQQAVQGLIEQLRRDEVFQAFERELASQGKQINAGQSLGATTADKGLLYLAVVESSGLKLNPTVYYRIELSAVEKGYRMQRAPQELCLSSKDENKVLGSPDGALMRLIGVYGIGSEDKLELQVVRPPKDPCLLGLGTLACLDTQRWLVQKQEEINRRKLQMHNITAQQGYYNIVYATKAQYLFDLLLGGFDDLTEEQIEQLYSELSLLYAQAARSHQPDPQFVEALRILAALNPEQLTSWMTALAQAFSEGQFDEEYERLLPQGLDKFEQIIMLLRGGFQNREGVKEYIRGVAQEIIAASCQPADPCRIVDPTKSSEIIARTILENLIQYLDRYFFDVGMSPLLYRPLLGEIRGYFEAILQALGEYGMRSEIVPFALGVCRLVMHIQAFWPDPVNPPLPNGPNGWDSNYRIIMESVMVFLRWMTETGGPYAPDRRARLEQGLGSLYTAVYLMLRSPADPIGWLFVGFRFGVEGWVGLVMWMDPGRANLGDNKGVIALIRGDHCSQCAGKVEQIVKWVQQALNELRHLVSWAEGHFKTGALGIIMLTFTRPGATGIDQIVSRLQQQFGNETAPIIALWFDKDGNVQFACISEGCRQLEKDNPDLIAKIKTAFARALAIAMAAYPGLSPQLAWWLAYGTCGGDPDCILWLAEEIAKELGSGGGANCQWRLQPLHPQPRLKALMPC